MTRYVLKRLAVLGPVLIGVSIVAFSIIHLVPGDPVRAMTSEAATEADIAAFRHQLGLDRPLHEQYVDFVWKAARGDFGRSIRTRRMVSADLAARFPATLQLASTAMALAIILGVSAGIVTATRQYSVWDAMASLLSLAGVSMPIFWLGLMLILVFSVHLGWLPPTGRDSPASVILPAIALSSAAAAIIARQTRSGLLEVLSQDYVRTARAKGLREWVIVLRHAIKNAMIPTVTVVGLEFGILLGGSVVTETVFSWPGVGRYVVDAVIYRDYPAVQATILMLSVIFVLVNLLVDLLYAWLDPRIRYA